jgi:hypothetical protein
MAEGKVFACRNCLFDFIQTEKKELLGRLLNGLRIRIEVVQNKYATSFVLAFVLI